MRKVKHCEYCGVELSAPVHKWHDDEPVGCGERECNRYVTEWHIQRREEAQEQTDRDLGYY